MLIILTSVGLILTALTNSAPFSAAAGVDSGEGVSSVLPDLSKASRFNGISPKNAANFWDKWHLVTTRYRKDAGEIRFVYANAIAWKAILAGKKVFPEGSELGKLAFNSKIDDAFPVSLVPSKFSRVQLMIKNSKAYPANHGWGYALYTNNLAAYKKTSEQQSVVTACAACHEIAKNKDYVFSEAAFFQKPDTPLNDLYKNKFEFKSPDNLSNFEKIALLYGGIHETPPKGIRYLKMPLFLGSIWESFGPLTRFATQDNMVYLLSDEEDRKFLVAVPLPPTPNCPNPVSFAMTHDPAQSADGLHISDRIRSGTTCDTVIQHENPVQLWPRGQDDPKTGTAF